MFCIKCGNKLESEGAYCKECGNCVRGKARVNQSDENNNDGSANRSANQDYNENSPTESIPMIDMDTPVMEPKKSNNKLIIILASIAAVTVIAVASIGTLASNNDKDNKGEVPTVSGNVETKPKVEPVKDDTVKGQSVKVEEGFGRAIPDGSIGYVEASSYKVEEGNSETRVYDAFKATDGNKNTAWVEGAAGYGEGEWITITLNRECEIKGLIIENGYKKQYKDKVPDYLYNRNSRPKKIRLTFDDGSAEEVILHDNFNKENRIKLSYPRVASQVGIQIMSVYPGSEYTDTCISEVRLFE
ncbi:MAG: discoidin domain-containing protein [Clostridium sp.]